MTATFTPPVTADSNSNAEFNVSGISSKFADGYEQFTTTGINAVLGKVMPSWTNLSYTQAMAILNFLLAQEGQTFYYIPNGESAPRVFRCKTWAPKWKHGRRCDISATFEPGAPNS